MEAWLEGHEDQPVEARGRRHDRAARRVPHVFRNAGEGQLRLLGIHGSPTRIVHRME